MAARFIDISDFIGFYKVDENFYDSDIVEKIEEETLRDLLGNSLYDDFISDLVDDEPVSQIWIDFKDGMDYTDETLIHYKGISEMLVAFAFYALIMDANNSSSSGFTKNLNQNSRVLNEFEKRMLAFKAWNLGVNLYMQAEEYLSFYPDSYQNWDHKTKAFKNLITY